MSVRVAAPLPNGTILTNRAWVTSTEGITGTGTVIVPVASGHVLTLTKTAAPSPVQAGALLTYTLAWAVGGNETALGVQVHDLLPAHTGLVAATDSFTSAGSLLGWSLGDRSPGESGVITIVVQVGQPMVSGTLLYNSAVMDDGLVSASADVTVPVHSGHALSLSKSATPAVVRPGELITYAIAYTITGNEPVFSATLTDALPPNTSFVMATLPHTLAGSNVVWALGDFLPEFSGITQAAGAVSLVLRAATPLTNGLVLFNSAVITDTGAPVATATATTTVSSQHALAVTKIALPDPVQAGGLLTYTLVYTVSGDGIAPAWSSVMRRRRHNVLERLSRRRETPPLEGTGP